MTLSLKDRTIAKWLYRAIFPGRTERQSSDKTYQIETHLYACGIDLCPRHSSYCCGPDHGQGVFFVGGIYIHDITGC